MSTVHFSSTITALAPAMAAAQAAMGSAQTNSKNGHFRSKYANLASCLHAALPALKDHGLSIQQHPGYDPTTQIVSMTTCILHKSGEWMQSTCCLPLGGKKDGHALKSATTYLRRTTLVSILGLPEEDDDGNAASVVAPRRAAPPITVATEEQLSQYRSDLEDKGFDPKLVADFFHTHGKPSAANGSMDQLVKRGMWVARNYPTIQQWGEQR